MLALAVLAALTVAACGSGSERGADAYGRSFYETAAPIREHYVEADKEMEKDPASAIVTLLGLPWDLTAIFDAIVEHAPDEIKADTEEARDALKKQQESLGEGLSDPLKVIGSDLVIGLTSSGSFSRVDEYLQEHCSVNPELAQRIIHESQ